MGREQRRKEAKKNKTNIKEMNNDIDSGVETYSLIKITIIVVALLAILYLVLAIFVTKELDLSTEKDKTSETNSEQQNINNAILASSTFKQSDETYYVFFYGFNDEEQQEIVNSVLNKLTDQKVYKVDTDSGLNKNYVSDISNPNVTSIDNLKVKSPTLIQISADKVSQYIEGKEKIEAYLTK